MTLQEHMELAEEEGRQEVRAMLANELRKLLDENPDITGEQLLEKIDELLFQDIK